jgi:hypothetical protein
MKKALGLLFSVVCPLAGTPFIIGGLFAIGMDVSLMSISDVAGEGGGVLLSIGLLAVLVGSLTCWVGWRLWRSAAK